MDEEALPESRRAATRLVWEGEGWGRGGSGTPTLPCHMRKIRGVDPPPYHPWWLDTFLYKPGRHPQGQE